MAGGAEKLGWIAKIDLTNFLKKLELGDTEN
jgi:hypothetical protein